MLNAIGLQNPGVDYVVREILPGLDFSETRFIANVCGSTIDEYVEVTRRFDDSRIDAIEINISCPNIKEGGVQFGNVPEMSARVVEACRRVTLKPLITKLSPNQSDIRTNARLCIDAGTDALAVINTVTGMSIDIESRKPILGNTQGGLSGPAIKPIALLKVKEVYEIAGPRNIPIIGQGGITTASDAIDWSVRVSTRVSGAIWLHTGWIRSRSYAARCTALCVTPRRFVSDFTESTHEHRRRTRKTAGPARSRRDQRAGIYPCEAAGAR
jgi:dihydroorotate dehydrogenase (NAD+) catalytic subunit